MENQGHTPSKAWKTIAGLLAAVTLLAPESAFAPVFRVWPGGAEHGATTAGRPGWTRAYRAELEINGGRGEMEVLGVTLPAATALDTLRATYEGLGGDVAVAMGHAMGWGVARVGDRVIRLLVVALEGPRECVVFRFEQTREAFERSQKAEDNAAVGFAGGRERRVVTDSENRLDARTVESGAEPIAAAAAIGRALVAEGWRPALPDAPNAGLYVRGLDVCAVRVTAREGPGAGSRALIVRKRLGIE